MSNGGVSASYDFDHSHITTPQTPFPLTAHNKHNLAETCFQKLEQPHTSTAESTGSCKIIFALIDDLFSNTRRTSKVKLIRDFADHKIPLIDFFQNKCRQISDIYHMLEKESRHRRNRTGARVQNKSTASMTRLCKARLAQMRSSRGGKQNIELL